MKASDVIQAIKEFFLEFVGYFLPGLVSFFLVYIFLKSSYRDIFNLVIENEEYRNFGLVTSWYILGYVVYGISIMKDKFIDTYNSFLRKWISEEFVERNSNLFLVKFWNRCFFKQKEEIEQEIENSIEFQMSLEAMGKLTVDSTFNDEFQVVTPCKSQEKGHSQFSMMRSIAMSYAPESSNKVYVFTFRSDLASHISAVSFFVGSYGLINFLIEYLFGSAFIFRAYEGDIIFFVTLLIIGRLLHETSIRFFRISKKIPFSIFLAKFYPIENRPEA